MCLQFCSQSNKWCELQSNCEQYQIIINDVVITCGQCD